VNREQGENAVVADGRWGENKLGEDRLNCEGLRPPFGKVGRSRRSRGGRSPHRGKSEDRPHIQGRKKGG